mmetsp:Transcript_23295/g.78894  ORF Transcript_23295/g.78894 Transcript_23295/m.78894 type:complete len:209 (+) Transcript_23295:268-894(+)
MHHQSLEATVPVLLVVVDKGRGLHTWVPGGHRGRRCGQGVGEVEEPDDVGGEDDVEALTRWPAVQESIGCEPIQLAHLKAALGGLSSRAGGIQREGRAAALQAVAQVGQHGVRGPEAGSGDADDSSPGPQLQHPPAAHQPGAGLQQLGHGDGAIPDAPTCVPVELLIRRSPCALRLQEQGSACDLEVTIEGHRELRPLQGERCRCPRS